MIETIFFGYLRDIVGTIVLERGARVRDYELGVKV